MTIYRGDYGDYKVTCGFYARTCTAKSRELAGNSTRVPLAGTNPSTGQAGWGGERRPFPGSYSRKVLVAGRGLRYNWCSLAGPVFGISREGTSETDFVALKLRGNNPLSGNHFCGACAGTEVGRPGRHWGLPGSPKNLSWCSKNTGFGGQRTMRNSFATKLLSIAMMLLTPAAMLMAETGNTMLYASGNVTLNGKEVARSASVATGDKIETAGSTATAVSQDGSKVTVNPYSEIRYQSAGVDG